MAAKFKITGFARLLLFLLVFAPIAYIGASFITGGDGLDKIKNLFSSKPGDQVEQSNEYIPSESEEVIKELRIENAQLKRKIRELEAELSLK